MQTIHLKAENNVIEDILKHINKLNRLGKNVELLDNETFELENNYINQALKEEKEGKTSSHDEVWNELLAK